MKVSLQVFDIDNNGTISAEEFKAIMTSRGNKMEEAEVNEMLLAADTNKDGLIDYREFARMLDGGRGAFTPMGRSVASDPK